MEHHIFAPLEMERTGYFAFDGSHLVNSATGHRYHWGNLKPFKDELSYATSASAGLSSNVSDLAKFIGLILNDGEGGMICIIRDVDIYHCHILYLRAASCRNRSAFIIRL